jgi:hypothetical protein
MKLTRLRGECPDGRTCPSVNASDRGTAVIVGRAVTDPEALAHLAIGPDEVAVEVPGVLLPEVLERGNAG